MQRICVVGCCGAGKSTLARALSARLALPLVHLDAIYWLPGWQEPEIADFRDRVERVVERAAWIVDGNYSRTYDQRLPRADLIVWLDYPRWRCFWQIARRIFVHRGQVRPDMAPGCPERLDWSFLRFVWAFPTHSRQRLVDALDRLGIADRCLRFTEPRQAKAWLSSLEPWAG